jgi:BirA family biotin operon repressor/biotin-[acetyl-CoA-carboxylase] ligase
MNESTFCIEMKNLASDGRQIGCRVIPFDTIDSTNTYALREGQLGDVIVADRQTLGRGRVGRTWFSEPGLGLWFTAVVAEPTEGLTFASALAVREAVADRCALQIKWPNDLLYKGKKVCGILVENRNGATAVGIGLNVHHRREDFPEELREKAGSLSSVAGGEWDRAALLRDVLNALDRKVMLLTSGGFETIRRDWADACNLIGRRIRNGALEGVVTEIDGRGAIILDTPSGVERIISGEIGFLDGD